MVMVLKLKKKKKKITKTTFTYHIRHQCLTFPSQFCPASETITNLGIISLPLWVLKDNQPVPFTLNLVQIPSFIMEVSQNWQYLPSWHSIHSCLNARSLFQSDFNLYPLEYYNFFSNNNANLYLKISLKLSWQTKHSTNFYCYFALLVQWTYENETIPNDLNFTKYIKNFKN